jgi:GT2 family glycosyltransferase
VNSSPPQYLQNRSLTAIVTAHRRTQQTIATLERLRSCGPAPDEILVHVDAGGEECRAAVSLAFPEIRILSSETPTGPGGARNKLIKAAKNEIVASFDDDSYPVDLDYFARLQQLFAAYPEAAVVTAEVFTRNESLHPPNNRIIQVASFLGGACAYRKSAFLQTQGYVPLPVAYGMEEVDVALQLHALGQQVLKASCLRVFHDTDYSGHASSKLVSGTIANTALFVYLRYPLSAWPRGTLQTANAVVYAVRHGRWLGVTSGLLMIPGHLLDHRHHRRVVSSKALRSYLALRLNPSLIRRKG